MVVKALMPNGLVPSAQGYASFTGDSLLPSCLGWAHRGLEAGRPGQPPSELQARRGPLDRPRMDGQARGCLPHSVLVSALCWPLGGPAFLLTSWVCYRNQGGDKCPGVPRV